MEKTFKYTMVKKVDGEFIETETSLPDPDGKLQAMADELTDFWKEQEEIAGDCEHDHGTNNIDDVYYCRKCGACLQIG